VEIEIDLRGPMPWASVEARIVRSGDDGERIILDPERELHAYNQKVPTGKGNLERFATATDEEIQIDLSHSHSFTDRTILAIADLLRGNR
jgi:hypothetical protein